MGLYGRLIGDVQVDLRLVGQEIEYEYANIRLIVQQIENELGNKWGDGQAEMG